MNRWLQTKEYECHTCGAIYLRDRARHHAVSYCPAQKQLATSFVCHCMFLGRYGRVIYREFLWLLALISSHRLGSIPPQLAPYLSEVPP